MKYQKPSCPLSPSCHQAPGCSRAQGKDVVYLLTAEGSLAPAPIPGSFQDPRGSWHNALGTPEWQRRRAERSGREGWESWKHPRQQGWERTLLHFHSKHAPESWRSSLPKVNAYIYHCQGDFLATQALLVVPSLLFSCHHLWGAGLPKLLGRPISIACGTAAPHFHQLHSSDTPKNALSQWRK